MYIAQIGRLLQAGDDMGLRDNTVVLFTSDHGDMRGSQGLETKCYPWDESIRVPFLLRWPAIGRGGERLAAPLDAPDIMPTLMGLCDLSIPERERPTWTIRQIHAPRGHLRGEAETAEGSLSGKLHRRIRESTGCITPGNTMIFLCDF